MMSKIHRTKTKIGHILIPISCIIVLLAIVWTGITMNRYATATKRCSQIKAGENIQTTMGDGVTAPTILHGLFVILQADVVKIPLVEACYYGNVQAVETLLNNGADPNYSIRDNWTPIEAAMNGTASEEDCFKIMKLLVEHGANVDGYESTEPVLFTLAGRLTLKSDAEHEHEMILCLLDHSAVPTEPVDNQTVLHYAARGTDVAFVTALIEDYRLDVNAKGFEGQTPLIAALRYKNPSATAEQVTAMVQTLIAAGADISVVDDHGKTAYDYAIENHRKDIAEILARNHQ